MTNWENIHPDFTEELQKEWETLNFKWEEVQAWIEKGSLFPDDAGFAFYLLSCGYEPEEMEDKDIEELRESYGENHFFKQRTRLEDWKNIHFNFTSELIVIWKNLGFSLKEAKEWIDINLQPIEAKFCAWLMINGLDSEQVLNYGNYEELQGKYQQHLWITQQEQPSK